MKISSVPNVQQARAGAKTNVEATEEINAIVITTSNAVNTIVKEILKICMVISVLTMV